MSAKGARTVVGLVYIFHLNYRLSLEVHSVDLKLFYSILYWMSNFFYFCLFASEQIYFHRCRDKFINTISIHFCEMQEGISSPAAYTYIYFQHNLKTRVLPVVVTDC